MFEQSARDLVKKLEHHTDPKALLLRAEAESLASVFEGWKHTRPDEATRADTIKTLIDLNRRVLIYISKLTRG